MPQPVTQTVDWVMFLRPGLENSTSRCTVVLGGEIREEIEDTLGYRGTGTCIEVDLIFNSILGKF